LSSVHQAATTEEEQSEPTAVEGGLPDGSPTSPTIDTIGTVAESEAGVAVVIEPVEAAVAAASKLEGLDDDDGEEDPVLPPDRAAEVKAFIEKRLLPAINAQARLPSCTLAFIPAK